jgi:hypothetical protein
VDRSVEKKKLISSVCQFVGERFNTLEILQTHVEKGQNLNSKKTRDKTAKFIIFRPRRNAKLKIMKKSKTLCSLKALICLN